MKTELLNLGEILLIMASSVIVKLIVDYILPGNDISYDRVLLYCILGRVAHVSVDLQEFKRNN